MKAMRQVYDYADRDEFYEDAEWPMYALRDGDYRWWLVWCTEDGDWFGTRALDEDDPQELSSTDPHRPVGPVSLDAVATPWRAIALDSFDAENEDES